MCNSINIVILSIKRYVPVDLTFRVMHFPLDGELDFYLKMILLLKKNDLKSPLIFVLVLKG